MIWHIHHEVIITVSLVDIIFSYKYKVKEVEKNTFFSCDNSGFTLLKTFVYNIEQC